MQHATLDPSPGAGAVMPCEPEPLPAPIIVERAHLQQLFDALAERGYSLMGPTVRDGAIIYDRISSVEDLPAGWTDEQEGGTYRLVRRDDNALFAHSSGPYSWKRFLHPPTLRLWRARRDENGRGFSPIDEPEEVEKLAFIGVRSCDLHAIEIQDRVFLGDQFTDPHYRVRRENAFVMSVNCTRAGNTCFCASMGTGPRVSRGFDLALTEVLRPGSHFFVVEVGTPLGAEIVAEVPHSEAREVELSEVERITTEVAANQGRTLQTEGLKELLYNNLDHPRWEEVAARCLACGNCTLVCPTCFCVSVEDTSDLEGKVAERWRRWDSCFTADFSYIHGGSVRASGKSRYRQWMTHKLATWYDQFGTSGCVGCGRCITWCPVGIDITEEARAIRESQAAPAARIQREKQT